MKNINSELANLRKRMNTVEGIVRSQRIALNVLAAALVLAYLQFRGWI